MQHDDDGFPRKGVDSEKLRQAGLRVSSTMPASKLSAHTKKMRGPNAGEAQTRLPIVRSPAVRGRPPNQREDWYEHSTNHPEQKTPKSSGARSLPRHLSPIEHQNPGSSSIASTMAVVGQFAKKPQRSSSVPPDDDARDSAGKPFKSFSS